MLLLTGKYFVMYVLPALIILPLTWKGVRYWYINHYGKSVKEQRKVAKATEKYEHDLGLDQPKKKGNKKK